MALIELAEIAEVMEWHKSDDHKDGKHIGVFIKVPRKLSEQFPKNDKDSSPSHITVLFVGQFNETMEDKLVKVVQDICSLFKPFIVRFGPKVRTFPDEGDGMVVYSPVKSGKLRNLHDALKYALLRNQIQIDNNHPEYRPHITIGYAENREEKNRLKELVPEGEFVVKDLWLWGLQDVKLISLGKK